MRVVIQNLPSLSYCQSRVLALWSFGIVLARSCGLTTVSAALGELLDRKETSVRQQLREWYRDRGDKAGAHRQDWQVSQTFAPLLKWVLCGWGSEEHQVTLAMDATTLKTLFTVLCISVVYRGCAIPVAWTMRGAYQAGSWQQPWQDLFAHLQGAIPPDWRVVVMADRGLYAKWLFTTIQGNGWHPYLRLNLRGMYRPKGQAIFFPIRQLLPKPGTRWAGAVTCFAHNSVESTLLAEWGAGYQEPWLILTDLDPQQADASEYAMRSWIEDGFKDLKRDGWQWQSTRMADPARAERLWLALALATLWVIAVGGEADAAIRPSHLDALPLTHNARRTKTHTAHPRSLSCFKRGILVILTALIRQKPLPLGFFLPEPWPLKTYP